MDNVPVLNTNEAIGSAPRVGRPVPERSGWLQSVVAAVPSPSRLMTVGYSFADQALAVGGMFLVNIMLARTQSKEEYGMFALSYSIYTFLTGLHNGAILEPFTVYGSGRYQGRFPEYLRLMTRANMLLGLFLSGGLLLVWLALWRLAPQYASRSLLGLGLTVGALLSGLFLRRAFYIQRKPAFAAMSSGVFFVTAAVGLWIAVQAQVLNSLYALLIVALGWVVAVACFATKLPFQHTQETFLQGEPGYWSVHWKYARWVLVTALVFQLTTQGYFWLSAGILSVKETGDLRAMYNLAVPVDQVMIAISFLVLPMMSRRAASRGVAGVLPVWKVFCGGALLVTGGFAACVNLFGKQVMHFLYAGKFDDVAPLLGMLALLPVVMSIGNTMNAALKSMEKPNLVFYAYVCSGSTTVLLGAPLVTHFGLRGVVYGLLLSAAAYTASLAAFLVLILSGKATGRPVAPGCEQIPGRAKQGL